MVVSTIIRFNFRVGKDTTTFSLEKWVKSASQENPDEQAIKKNRLFRQLPFGHPVISRQPSAIFRDSAAFEMSEVIDANGSIASHTSALIGSVRIRRSKKSGPVQAASG